MGVTNAISSVIIVGAILAAGPVGFDISKIFGIIAVILASINIFGGFIVTYRMLSMFKKKDRIFFLTGLQYLFKPHTLVGLSFQYFSLLISLT